MITLRNITTTFLLSLLFLFSACQDEDFGFTTQDVWKGVYSRNFIKTFGAVDPNENWDFSQFGHRHVDGALTRAGGSDAEDGWYRVDQRLIDDFFQTTLKEGVDNSRSGENFCLLTGHENFTLTPIYKSSTSTSNWALHMVLFKLDGNKVDQIVWSNSTTDVIKIQTDGCQYCEGRGFLADYEHAHAGEVMDCPACDNGWISDPNGDKIEGYKKCERCLGSGTTHDGVCPTCTGKAKLPCTTCNGTGYTSEKTGNGKGNNNKTFYSCATCNATKTKTQIFTGKQNAFNKNLVTYKNEGKLGSGQMDCTACGGDGKVDKICDVCLGDKYFIKCQVCNGTNLVYKCTGCDGTGLSNGSWQSITASGNQNHTTGAKAIEGHPVSAEACLGCAIPTDGVVYFYLEMDGHTHTSMEDGMRLFTPQVLNTGSEVVKLIACESGDGTNDYNDFVFLLSGSPTALRTEKEASFTSVVSKRYMAEDFGSNADWDFNDIVVDVTRTLTQKLSGNGKTIAKSVVSNIQFATIKWLCGTVPIQVMVGDKTFIKINDPTNEERTLDELGGETPTNTAKGEAHGWEVRHTEQITGWDPDANNITVYVWKDGDNGIEGNTSDVDVWQANFPRVGDVPYIIATETTATQNWTNEGVQIWTLDWFRQKYPNVHE